MITKTIDYPKKNYVVRFEKTDMNAQNQHCQYTIKPIRWAPPHSLDQSNGTQEIHSQSSSSSSDGTNISFSSKYVAPSFAMSPPNHKEAHRTALIFSICPDCIYGRELIAWLMPDGLETVLWSFAWMRNVLPEIQVASRKANASLSITDVENYLINFIFRLEYFGHSFNHRKTF